MSTAVTTGMTTRRPWTSTWASTPFNPGGVLVDVHSVDNEAREGTVAGQQRARTRGHDTPARARDRGHGPVGAPGHVGHGGMLDDVPVPVWVVLWCLLLAMLGATTIGFLLSYEALHRLADGHGLTGLAAWVWPSAVDSFICIGELGTTVLIWLRHAEPSWWKRVPWPFVGITGAGFAGSLAANLVEAGPDPAARLVAAVPPVAALGAFAGLTYVGHALLSPWQERARRSAPAPDDVPEVAAAPVPAANPVVPLPVPQPARRPAAARAPRPEVVVPVSGDDRLPELRARARLIYAESMVAGTPVSVKDLQVATGMGEKWCKNQRSAVGKTVEDARAYLRRVQVGEAN